MNGHERPYGFERGLRRRLRGLWMPAFNTQCSSSTEASFLSQPSSFVLFFAPSYTTLPSIVSWTLVDLTHYVRHDKALS
jgi:hypothetical protein